MKLQIIRASLALVTFLVCCGLSCFVAWCGGYDFDKRNDGVGAWVFITLLFSADAAAIAGYVWSKPKKTHDS